MGERARIIVKGRRSNHWRNVHGCAIPISDRWGKRGATRPKPSHMIPTLAIGWTCPLCGLSLPVLTETPRKRAISEHCREVHPGTTPRELYRIDARKRKHSGTTSTQDLTRLSCAKRHAEWRKMAFEEGHDLKIIAFDPPYNGVYCSLLTCTRCRRYGGRAMLHKGKCPGTSVLSKTAWTAMIRKRRHIAECLATAWGVTVDEVKDFYPGRGERVSRAPKTSIRQRRAS